ncbi:HAD family hydrolase [Vibrio palustris]|uniref:6-phosphogluconate phosphatase n=1 Tax=Vibrio palustris TaxID=1918946 RepID=A0A1R4B6U3_9VIBR|nr:HAD-IA family hydrolase [Vibrio palustris]SJL84634.1 6-phosphogluconate phosphatase [Vibrio palustris]
MQNLPIQCVIFDCEGTLIDSETLCCQALHQLFQDKGVTLPIEQVTALFDGGKSADILMRLLEYAGLHWDLDELEQNYRARTEQLFAQDLIPMDGVVDLLERLTAQNIDVCVASNGPQHKICRLLELAGLAGYFKDRVFSAFEANSWKPEPDLIHYCAMGMGYRLAECLYIDDTVRGITAGLRAGVETYHLQTLSRAPLVYTPGCHTIRHLNELQTVLWPRALA